MVPEVIDDGELWYRDNDTDAQWEPLDTLQQAINILQTRSPLNPWAGVGRFTAFGYDGEAGQVHLFEVLGWADRIYVCGDISRPGYQWRWSSWPITGRRGGLTPATVGPNWYQAAVYEEQLVTIHDAIAQLRPALHAIDEVAEQAPGFLWLPSEQDLAPNQHLRRPLDGQN
jgi:hypothetical protein